MRKVLFACGLAVFVCVVVHGQPQNAPQAQQMQHMQKLQTAMADAQAKATRPGDTGMSCEALQTELQAAVLDPAVQAVAKQNGAVAQEKLDDIEKGNAAAKAAAATQIASGLFAGLASAFVPGVGALTGASQQAAARAQAAQAQAAAAKNVQDMNVMMERMITILPQMMRGQRVMEVAYAKQCPWIMAAIPPGSQGVNPFGQTPGR